VQRSAPLAEVPRDDDDPRALVFLADHAEIVDRSERVADNGFLRPREQ
jgi:hypothetical protein